MNKILIIGQSDHDNFGDSLIFLAYIKMIKEIMIDFEIDIYSPSDIFLRRLELNGITGHKQDCSPDYYSAVIFIPGGYFGCPDFTDFKWQLKWRKGLIYKSIEFCQTLNCPIFIHGVEVGPRLKPLVFRYIYRFFDTIKSPIYVRNIGSSHYCARAFDLKAEVLPDYIFSLAEPISESRKTDFDLAIHATGKVFADNLISKNFLSVIIKSIYECDDIKKILIFSDQVIKNEFKERIKLFIGKMLEKRIDVIVEDYNGLEKTLQLAGKAGTIITSKLHIGVCALNNHRKVISIASHPKLNRFYFDNDLSQYTADYFFSSNTKKNTLIKDVIKMDWNTYCSDRLMSNMTLAKSIYKDTLKKFLTSNKLL